MWKILPKSKGQYNLLSDFDTIKRKDYLYSQGGFIVLRIGDFSKIGKVSIKTLRLYDQLGLLIPEEIDYSTGYRKYSVYQLNRLNRILFYKDLGFSLKDISGMINKELTIEETYKILEKRKGDLKKSIEEATQNLDLIENRINQIKLHKNIPVYDIKVVEPKTFNVVSLRVNIPTLSEFTYYSNQCYEYIYKELHNIGVKPLEHEFNLYHVHEYTQEDLDIEFCVSIEDNEINSQKIGKTELNCRRIKDENLVAILFFTGDYHELDTPIIELLKWIDINGYEFDGELRELHLSGKAHIDGLLQKDVAVELQMPIKK